jgi:DNA repair protein RadC
MEKTSYLTIKELPQNERPRERLEKFGPEALSDAELLAIILRVGSVKFSAVSMAQHMLKKFGSLKNLAKASIEELCHTPGIGKAKAIQIKAAFALGSRLNTFREPDKFMVRSARDIADLMLDEMRLYDKECFKIILLDTKNHIIRTETVTVGLLDASLIHPREVFRTAIRANSSSVIAIHNHPSGDPTPSEEDNRVTKRLKEASKLLGITLLDHIIIGDHHQKPYYSYRDEGLL